MKTPSFERIVELQSMLFDFTQIDRLIHFPDRKIKDRQENNAEHSFSLAMMAWYLSAHYPHLNTDKLIRYSLIHDIVELHAGDEQAVGRTKEAEKAKKEREYKAFLQIKKEWADFPDMVEHIQAYEYRSDAESKFVYALDKIMPLLLNMLSGGKTWKLYKFTKEDVLSAKDHKVIVSPEIAELWAEIRPKVINKDLFWNN